MISCHDENKANERQTRTVGRVKGNQMQKGNHHKTEKNGY
jgi:hypothetical protein